MSDKQCPYCQLNTAGAHEYWCPNYQRMGLLNEMFPAPAITMVNFPIDEIIAVRDQRIKQLEEERQWKSIEKELPPTNVIVLAWGHEPFRRYTAKVGVLVAGVGPHWVFEEVEKFTVTHWMSIPQGPD